MYILCMCVCFFITEKNYKINFLQAKNLMPNINWLIFSCCH